MASVTVAEDPRNGSHYIQVYKNGKRPKFYYGKGKAGKTAAEDAAKKLRAQIHDSNFKLRAKSEQMTLRELVKLMWADAGDCTEFTVTQYRNTADRLFMKALGDKNMHDITHDDIKALHNAWAKKYKPKTALVYRTILQSVMLEAVRRGLIAKSPDRTTRAQRRTKKSAALNDNVKRIKALSMEQLNTLLDALDATQNDIVWRVFWLFMANTGVRCSEGITVQWDDIDLEKGDVLIQRAAERKVGVGLTKTGMSRRVQLSDDLVAALRELQQAHPKRRGSDWVFFNVKENDRFSYSHVQREMKAVVDTMRYSHRVTAHILRHTYASLLLGESTPITYVSEQLGHANPHITLRVYSHFIPKGDGKPVNVLDQLRAASTHAVRTQKGKRAVGQNTNLRVIK